MIYAIEGIDAAGKATQARILANRLGAQVLGFPDYTTPSGRALASHLQGLWSANGVGQTDMLVRQSLMLTNRMEHFDQLARCSGTDKHLVLDRYWASGMAYGQAEGLDPAWLALIHKGLPRADVWILLDVDPRVGVERRPERRDDNERDVSKLDAARANYLRLFASSAAGSFGDTASKWVTVMGTGTIEDVAQRIANACGLPPA